MQRKFGQDAKKKERKKEEDSKEFFYFSSFLNFNGEILLSRNWRENQRNTKNR